MRRLSELISLEGRRALVTGGAGHIGLAVSEALLELGATVAVVDLDKKACAERCRALNTSGFAGTAVPFAVDLSSEKGTRKTVSQCIETMKGLDILIHCAAFVGTTAFPGWGVPFEKQTLAAWDAAARVNLSSTFVMVQEARPALMASGHASVIFISSIYGTIGPDNRIYEGTPMVMPAGYAASKGGLNQFARYLATTLAPEIRANTIIAGGVQRGQPKVFQKRYSQKTPLARMACEEDFKGAVAYLASDLSAYVTGSELFVDGGWSAW
jgi:NAD(P)-dependent dehydrogenase (short-subunit alcohol dehydrogenase family)